MIRGIVTSVIEGLIKLLAATGRSGETFANREYFQHYGFTSRPLAGAEVIIIHEGNHYLAIASDDRRYRLAVEDGEVALYTDEGDKIHLKRDNTIEIVSGNKLIATVENDVEITSKTATVTATESCEINTKVATVTATESCEITSPEVTINAATSLAATSPAVTINAATSCIINSPNVQLGGSSGTMRYLCDERLLQWLRDHKHGVLGATPYQTLTDADVRTAITKGA